MIYKIVKYPDPILEQKSEPVTDFGTPELELLVENMFETMYASKGVGLAAPQIGELLQLAVIEDRAEYHKTLSEAELKERGRTVVPFHVIVNPVLELRGAPSVTFFEGCLSLPGYGAMVSRETDVRVTCLDHRGEPQVIEASGWHARILQHEIDHLRGTLYIDRMHPRSFSSLENYTRHWKNQSSASVLEALAKSS